MWRIVVSLLLACWCFGTSQSQIECEQVDSCSCDMSDGSGRIDLRSLAHNSYTSDNSIFNFLYTPCEAMQNATGECRDGASVCLQFKEGGLGYNYGRADSARFSVDPATKQARISYSHVASNVTRVSNVNLICDPDQREKALFELESAEPLLLNFRLTSVCACPGACLSPAVTCTMKDSCTCEMSDGSGEINLHPLDNPWAPFRVSHFSPKIDRNFTYYYNPCSGLTFANTRCTEVSGCQVDAEATPEQLFYALGQVLPPPTVEVDEEGNVVLVYGGLESGRHFDLTLICDAEQHVPEFTTIGEITRNYYKMTLKTKCACPGLCKDDPIARKARYLKWKASNPD